MKKKLANGAIIVFCKHKEGTYLKNLIYIIGEKRDECPYVSCNCFKVARAEGAKLGNKDPSLLWKEGPTYDPNNPNGDFEYQRLFLENEKRSELINLKGELKRSEKEVKKIKNNIAFIEQKIKKWEEDDKED